MTKSGLVLLACLLTASMAQGQRRVKYEDVLPSILSSDPAAGIATLKSFHDKDPINPSISLQLGLIYERRFLESDPIIGYKKAMANIELAKASFSSSKLYLNEKDVKKNKEEYINFAIYDDRGKFTVSLDSILKKIDEATAVMREFEQHVPDIYSDFTQSYSHYDKANKIFTEIISNHRSIKDLYLLYDDQMARKFSDIKLNYNQSIAYFKSYKEKSAVYDIGYDQHLKIQPIDIYRLDGLAVEINFLERKEILLWDYAKWVDETESYIQQNINSLRKLIVDTEKSTSSKIKNINQDLSNGDFTPLEIDKQFLFALKKYDLNSLLEPIFRYREKLHERLIKEHHNKSFIDNEETPVDHKILNYGLQLSAIRDSDTLLQHIQTRNTDLSYRKYKKFIDDYYFGRKGIDVMVDKERATNEDQFAELLVKVRRLLTQKYAPDSDGSVVKYRGASIPFEVAIAELEQLAPNLKVTTHKATNLDGSHYLGGIYLNGKTNLVNAFVCRVESNRTVSWYKDFALQIDGSADVNTVLATMVGGQAGCTFVLNGSQKDTPIKQNSLYSYNEDGAQVMVRDLLIDDFPRTIEFEEQTNSLLIGFNGRELANENNELSQITLAKYNVIGELLWQFNQNLVGNLIGVVSIDDGYLINGNYSKIRSKSGEVYNVSNGFASFLIKIDNYGEWAKEKMLTSDNPYVTTHFLKAGEHTIHVLGSWNVNQRGFESQSDQLVHYIVNKNLDLVSRPSR